SSGCAARPRRPSASPSFGEPGLPLPLPRALPRRLRALSPYRSSPSALRRGHLLAGHGLARALTGARVRVRALAAHRQVPAVTHAAIAAEVDEPLDVLRNLAPEVAFDLEVRVDLAADLVDLVVCQVVGLATRIDLGAGADRERRRAADAVDVREGNLHPLVARQIDASDACHSLAPLSLSPAAACDGSSGTARARRRAGG